MASRFQIVITDFLQDDLAPERQILGDLADVVALDAFHESELTGRIEQADGVLLYHHLGLTQSTIARLEKCKIIIRCGVGFDNVDHAFARSRGIPVCNIPDYGTEEVADSAIGLTLALTRGIAPLNSRLRDRQVPWSYLEVPSLCRLRGRTFCIVGLGRIGTATALRAKALGMRVAFYDPHVPDGLDKALGVTRVESLPELFAQSHVLSLHCPLNAQTRHVVNATNIDLLPRGAFLINTARGAVVDTDCIPAALASGRLAGAGIDVLEQEPPRADDPLLVAWRDPAHPAHDRLLLNPHSAFYCEEGLMEMRVKGAEACRRALLGLPLRNVIN